ncbi:MAG: hypothetical protein Kow0037_30950 [Calditrichia bacterium]
MYQQFTETELLAYINGKLPGEITEEMRRHIENNENNKSLLEHLISLKEISRSKKDQTDRFEVPPMPEGIKKQLRRVKQVMAAEEYDGVSPVQPGEIYLTKLPANWPYRQPLRSVLIIKGPEESANPLMPDLVVAPLINVHLKNDSLFYSIPESESPFGSPYTVQLDNFQPMLKACLHKKLGSINNEILDLIIEKHLSLMEKENTDAEGEKFPEKELEITRYLREPVNKMLALQEEVGISNVLDLTYLLPHKYLASIAEPPQFPWEDWENGEVIRGLWERLFPPIYRRVAEAEYLPLAAQTGSLLDVLEKVHFTYTLFENEHFALALYIFEDEMRLGILSDISGGLVEIEFKDGFELVARSERAHLESGQVNFLHVKNMADLFNRLLNVEIKIGLDRYSTQVYIAHDFLE